MLFPILFHPEQPPFFPLRRFRQRVCRIADGAVTDAFVVTRYAKLAEQRFPFITLKFFFCAVNPDTANRRNAIDSVSYLNPLACFSAIRSENSFLKTLVNLTSVIIESLWRKNALCELIQISLQINAGNVSVCMPKN